MTALPAVFRGHGPIPSQFRRIDNYPGFLKITIYDLIAVQQQAYALRKVLEQFNRIFIAVVSEIAQKLKAKLFMLLERDIFFHQ